MSASIPTAELGPLGRVLLIDDEPNVLAALERSLRAGGFAVATAARGDEALALLHREPVDAIVCDMRMPGMSGTEVLKRSLTLAPDALRVMLTGHAEIASAISAINEGDIFRYLTKPWDDLLLLQVLRDGLARKAIRRARPPSAERAPEEVLTRRQIEILTLIARGFATKESAFKLGLSPKTVDAHRASIMERLGIGDVAGLTLYCVRHGLVDPRFSLASRCG